MTQVNPQKESRTTSHAEAEAMRMADRLCDDLMQQYFGSTGREKKPALTIHKELAVARSPDDDLDEFTYLEAEIEIFGRSIPYRPATLTDPEEGGYFEVSHWKATLADYDVTELFTVDEVQAWANEELDER